MWVGHISLDNFRNYTHEEISFQPGPNLLIGANGQGKTNIVEAVRFFSSLSSHRTSHSQALIRSTAPAGVARMRIHRIDREVLLEIQLNREGPNKAQLNRSPVKPRELTEYFRSVMFAPEDLLIIRGEPTHRRNFIDEVMVERNPGLVSLISDYERVVRQRSALLKSLRQVASHAKSEAGSVDSTLIVWDDRLVSLGSRIIFERQALIEALRSPIRDAYKDLVHDDHKPELGYLSSLTEEDTQDLSGLTLPDVEATFRNALSRVRDKEYERGMTLIGPQRDDVLMYLNDLPVKGYASHGETWSFVLSLRLATAQLFRRESSAGDPVIILDDVFAELDMRRRERLFDALRDFEQVIVTAAVEEDVPHEVAWNINRIHAGRRQDSSGDTHVR